MYKVEANLLRYNGFLSQQRAISICIAHVSSRAALDHELGLRIFFLVPEKIDFACCNSPLEQLLLQRHLQPQCKTLLGRTQRG